MSGNRLISLVIILWCVFGCSSARPITTQTASDSYYCEAEPWQIEKIVGKGDFYRRQAPLPCLRIYKSVQTRDGQDGETAVAMAISGGGERAANFALGVLLALETIKTKQQNDVLSEIDYFSTVSGGGFAAGAYIAALHRHQQRSDADPQNSRFSLAAVTTQLEAALRHNFQRLLWQAAFVPWRGRNEVIRIGTNEVVLGREQGSASLTLGDIFIPNCAVASDHGNAAHCAAGSYGPPKLPYWFANATIAANGAIFPFAPDILSYYHVSVYPNISVQPNRNDIALTDVYAMPLAIGLTASASFPGAIPPLTVTTDAGTRMSQPAIELQFLDGGLGDNLGVLTALAVLKQDRFAKKKILLVVDAYPGTGMPYQGFSDRWSTLRVLLRTPSVSLDSWRGRHKYVLAEMAKGVSEPDESWNIIFFSFDDVASDNQRYELRAVGTNLSLSEAQQRKLIAAGRAVVDSKRDRICEVFACR